MKGTYVKQVCWRFELWFKLENLMLMIPFDGASKFSNCYFQINRERLKCQTNVPISMSKRVVSCNYQLLKVIL